VTTSEPGDRRPARDSPESPSATRRLERPPSERYGRRGTDGAPEGDEPKGASALAGPLVRSVVVAAAGVAALFVLGATLAETLGLLFVSGLTGAAIGLVLARASAPGTSAPPTPRRTVTWLAVAIAVSAVVIADLAIWANAINEGGTLGFVDYLLTAFGPFVPAEAGLAALTAAWGANAGPVQG
jgi:hypothetical protein